jgi:uncharacterized protein YjaG (DUF416 family)
MSDFPVRILDRFHYFSQTHVLLIRLFISQFNLQSQVDSARFVAYMCEQVLPQFDEISSNEEGADPQLEILKLFAELCTHCGTLENAESKVEKVFERLIVSQVVFLLSRVLIQLTLRDCRYKFLMCFSYLC